MDGKFLSHLARETQALKDQGLYKQERVLTSPQSARITAEGRKVINLCANNYLGLSNHPSLVKAARDGLGEYGFGLSSVRFICGTQSVHKELETSLSRFLGTEDTILYSSCFDANGGLFETILGAEDAVISDELNHASIIDGIRLAKAKRFRYKNNDMADLEARLVEAKDCRFKLISTDGVFSMDGIIANLPRIVALAEKYGALTMVDDSHAVGFTGANGRGTHELHDVVGKIDILTGTLGKALGGASGGYTSGRKEVVDWLRQRSRPYLFSNTLMPAIATASLAALRLLEESDGLRAKLRENSEYFRDKMQALGFDLVPGRHPIIPVMIGDAAKAKAVADALMDAGVYVTAFSYPVVPMGKARIRTQMSAAHSRADLEEAVSAFERVGKRLGIVS
jgi:glycine C-acetyltransferase